MTTTTAPVEAPEEFPEDVMKIAQHYIDLSRQFGAITTAHIAAAIMQDRRALTTSPATDDIGRLVERLREASSTVISLSAAELCGAATALLSQQSEINRLREAVAPLNFGGELFDVLYGDMPDTASGTITIPLGEMRRLREVVRSIPRAALPKAST